MHTASYEFLMKPEKSAGCHQTLSTRVGSGDKNREMRRSDEAQLAGYGLIYKDKKAAAQLNTSSYKQLIWYRCDQPRRNHRGHSI